MALLESCWSFDGYFGQRGDVLEPRSAIRSKLMPFVMRALGQGSCIIFCGEVFCTAAMTVDVLFRSALLAFLELPNHIRFAIFCLIVEEGMRM
eukprot:11629970-Alexandrium_andersonii.AAC.1